MRAPLGYQLFKATLDAADAASEDNNSWVARTAREGVVQGVHFLKRARGVEFPQRATGGWRWVWRWKFEFLMSWYEWQSIVWVRRLLRPGMTVVDLGAHVGYYSRLFSDIVGPTGRVFAFEPNPENLAMLRGNLRHRRYSNVEILPCAASDNVGSSRLFVSPGHSNHSLIPGFTAAEATIEVETTSIDAFVENRAISSIDFIKIDVEGSETLALSGMAETIRKSPGLCALIEFNPLALRSAGTTPECFLNLIGKLGFESAAILEDARLGSLPDSSDIDMYVNLICWKAGDRRFTR